MSARWKLRSQMVMIACLGTGACATTGTIPSAGLPPYLQPRQDSQRLPQVPLSIVAGWQVRVTTRQFATSRFESPLTIQGEVVVQRQDTLVLRVDHPVASLAATPELTLALASATAVSVRHGTRPAVAYGAILGGILGVAIGQVTTEPSDPWRPMGVAMVGGVGVLVGALVGTQIRRDRWIPVAVERLRVGARPVAVGTAAISVSLVF